MASKDWDDQTLTDGDSVPTAQWVEMAGFITTNISKVTNATHTGEVTGSTELTIADGAVDIANLSASGSASSTTYLRGDNTWAEVSSGTSSPLTTKGDLYTYGSDNARLPVGVNGQVLSSDSSEATGLKWIAAGGTGDMNTSTYDAAGVSEQLVGLTAEQTLTNKTLTSPVINNPTGLDAADISDFDTEVSNNSSVVANTAKVTNATHSGDVSGSTVLSIGENKVNDTHIDWGTGSNQVSADDVPDGNTNAIITLAQESSFEAKMDDLVDDTTPQLGGDLDLNGKSLTVEKTAGENVSSGDLCYLKSDGKYWKSDASAEATCSTQLLMATESITADSSGTFLFVGDYTTTGLTAGSIYYASETAGEITAIAPTTSGAIIRIVGTAESTTKLVFNPDKTFVEHV